MKIIRMDYINWVFFNMYDYNFFMRYYFEIRLGFNDN